MRVRYDVSSARSDDNTRQNHGKPWSSEQELAVRVMFRDGVPLENIAINLGRSSVSILQRLRNCDLVEWDSTVNAYFYDSNKVKHQPQPTESEPIMAKTIEVKTFIGGVDASDMTDEAIFHVIAQKEAERDSWSKIAAKPKKLQAVIDQIGKDIDELVAYVDAR